MIVKRYIFAFLALIPSNLAKLPYWVVFLLSKTFIRDHIIVKDIWPRHSFLEDFFVFGASDLDLTIILSDNITKEDYNTFRNKLVFIKSLFPIISEVNVFKEKDIIQFLSIANPIEISRDKKLQLKGNYNVIIRPEHQQVYLLKIIKNNINKLINSEYQFRLKKFKNLLIKININSNSNLFETIDYHLGINFQKQNITLDKILNNQLSSDQKFNLYTADWIAESFFAPNYKEQLLNLKDINILLIKENIYWEVWGISSQIYIMNQKSLWDIGNYIERIIDVLITIDFSEDKVLINNLKLLLKNIKQLYLDQYTF